MNEVNLNPFRMGDLVTHAKKLKKVPKNLVMGKINQFHWRYMNKSNVGFNELDKYKKEKHYEKIYLSHSTRIRTLIWSLR